MEILFDVGEQRDDERGKFIEGIFKEFSQREQSFVWWDVYAN